MGPTAGSTSSTDGGAAEPGGSRVALGRVVGAHGLQGALRVSALGDGEANWRRARQVWLARAEQDPEARHYEVSDLAFGRRGEVRLSLAGVGDRDAALALRGRFVLGRAADLARLPAGEYYAYQLVGCRVADAAGRALGVVSGIWETGAPALLVVAGDDGGERLIPAAGRILQEVDVEARRIVIDAIPGLLDPR